MNMGYQKSYFLFITLSAALMVDKLISGQDEGITEEDIRIATEQAREDLEDLRELEDELERRGLILEENSPSYIHQYLQRGDPEKIPKIQEQGQIGAYITNNIIENMERSTPSGNLSIPRMSVEKFASDVCPQTTTDCDCTDMSKYRTADGSCNNLKNGDWGKANTPFRRLLQPDYGGDKSEPKTRGVDGSPLPSARVVSTHWANIDEIFFYQTKVTLLMMQWGQFLDHDITLSVVTQMDGVSIKCCDSEIISNPDLKHEACFAIDIPENDGFYGPHNQTCLEFVRSLPAPLKDCQLGLREQLNGLTAFIDASMVYGSSLEQTTKLRSNSGGKLKGSEDDGSIMPPAESDLNKEKNKRSFLAGDARVGENTNLALLHHIFFREHNRIAETLASLNSGWDDETLFQEARRIVIAQVQHITYNEFLPVVLGKKVMAEHNLNGKQSGHSSDYDADLDPTISNAFATAAYRFGHTLVRGFLPRVRPGVNDKPIAGCLRLPTEFNTPFALYDKSEFDLLATGLARTVSPESDRFFTQGITNLLFMDRTKNIGSDLVAVNTQRGRDHGLPRYLEWRKFCNLSEVTEFSELERIMSDFEPAELPKFYKNVKDLDLFLAGIAEKNLDNAQVGPTFACILADQFRRLKFGDRFWYENGNMDHSFTSDQLQEIRKVSIARLMCDNSGIKEVQKKAFRFSRFATSCTSDEIPRMDLEKWRA